MKFAEELELANGRLAEAKRLYEQTIIELIQPLFEEIKDRVYLNKPFWQHMLQTHGLVPAIKIVREYADIGLKEAKKLVCNNKDFFIKLSSEEYNKKLLAREG